MHTHCYASIMPHIEMRHIEPGVPGKHSYPLRILSRYAVVDSRRKRGLKRNPPGTIIKEPLQVISFGIRRGLYFCGGGLAPAGQCRHR